MPTHEKSVTIAIIEQQDPAKFFLHRNLLTKIIRETFQKGARNILLNAHLPSVESVEDRREKGHLFGKFFNNSGEEFQDWMLIEAEGDRKCMREVLKHIDRVDTLWEKEKLLPKPPRSEDEVPLTPPFDLSLVRLLFQMRSQIGAVQYQPACGDEEEEQRLLDLLQGMIETAHVGEHQQKIANEESKVQDGSLESFDKSLRRYFEKLRLEKEKLATSIIIRSIQDVLRARTKKETRLLVITDPEHDTLLSEIGEISDHVRLKIYEISAASPEKALSPSISDIDSLRWEILRWFVSDFMPSFSSAFYSPQLVYDIEIGIQKRASAKEIQSVSQSLVRLKKKENVTVHDSNRMIEKISKMIFGNEAVLRDRLLDMEAKDRRIIESNPSWGIS